jgi:signal transduction histidine kinase
LTSGVAHEVRNPLNAIVALTEALSDAVVKTPEVLAYINYIQAHVERLSTLMKDLLELGDTARRQQFSNLPASMIIVEAYRYWRRLSPERKHRISISFPSRAREWIVRIDLQRMSQAIANIIENAVQFSPLESAVSISVAQADENYIKIKVIDRGSGIEQEYLPHVFSPFFTTRTGGTGLGLTLVKRIVQAHKGSVAIAPNENAPGVTVELKLPLQCIHAPSTAHHRNIKSFSAICAHKSGNGVNPLIIRAND